MKFHFSVWTNSRRFSLCLTLVSLNWQIILLFDYHISKWYNFFYKKAREFSDFPNYTMGVVFAINVKEKLDLKWQAWNRLSCPLFPLSGKLETFSFSVVPWFWVSNTNIPFRGVPPFFWLWLFEPHSKSYQQNFKTKTGFNWLESIGRRLFKALKRITIWWLIRL